MASATTLPWRIARWASIGSPVASPTAHTCGSAGATARVHLDESARGELGPGRLETQSGRLRPAADRDQHAIERGGVLPDAGLHGVADLAKVGHAGAQANGREHLLAAPGEGLHEIAVHAGQEAVGHLDEGHLAAERGVDLAQLEPDVAAADHQ